MQLEDFINNQEYKFVNVCGVGTLRSVLFVVLNPINSDANVLKFVEDVNGFELVDVYVKHCIENPEIIYESKLGHNVNFDDDVDDV